MHLLTLTAFLGLLCWVYGDTYLHFPRGSNNRLNEKSANRKNGNRVFDSQNNNRGGYNVGDREATPANKDASKQYQMKWFASSDKAKTYLPMRWTSQHGSGGDEDTNPNKMNANFVIQIMCQNQNEDDVYKEMRNGVKTDTPQYSRGDREEDESSFLTRRRRADKRDIVLQEPFEWHDKCYVRERNKGLFNADQKVDDNKGATATRQNPGGTQRGYECAEERDYYPYWHPTPWIDVKVFAKNASHCDYYKKESFNVKTKWECVGKFGGSTKHAHYSKFNNKDDCVTAGDEWLEFHQALEILTDSTTECENLKKKHPGQNIIWGRPINLDGDISKRCIVQPAAPDCSAYPFSRDNHLGNGAGLEEIEYDMPLPYFPSGGNKRCVIRTRYNITTDDYDGWNIDASLNDRDEKTGRSPVYNNPKAFFGAEEPLALAMNTAQFGRTFQDRTHIFTIQSRPNEMKTDNIKILSVQGKRGNIVQTYPAVEYDFVPRELKVSKKDLIHIQWTGSNTHNNGDSAGDGQQGDDGEGQGGTDRSNMLGMMERLGNWPLPNTHDDNFINHMEVKWSAYNPDGPPTPQDLAIQLATSGFYKSMNTAGGGLQNQLNNASPTFEGAIIRMKDSGKYHYMCSRNNNFSNRSQKGTIFVK